MTVKPIHLWEKRKRLGNQIFIKTFKLSNIGNFMHIISKSALVTFWKKHPNSEIPLQTWFKIMERGTFSNLNELRATFPSADYVDGLTVFNIGGNKYRLIVSIHYNRQNAYIKEVLTHQEYDRGEWKQRK